MSPNPYQPPYQGQPPPQYGYPGQQPGYPGQYPGYGPAPFSIEGIVSASKPAMALLAMRAALPLLYRALGAVGLGFGAAAGDGIKTLLGFAALIAFFVWFARAYAWVRATRGGTQYSTGLAIGGWFIPFANFVLPYLAMRDLWRRAMNDENGHLVVLWWLGYMASTIIAGVFSFMQSGVAIGGSATVWNLVGWVGTLAQIVGYGMLAYLIQQVSERSKRG